MLLPGAACSPDWSLPPATTPPIACTPTLADALACAQRERLRALLEVEPVEPVEPVSGLERLRAGPSKLTATELLDALLRLRDVRDVGVGQITVDVPPGRERAPARYGLIATTIRSWPREHALQPKGRLLPRVSGFFGRDSGRVMLGAGDADG